MPSLRASVKQRKKQQSAGKMFPRLTFQRSSRSASYAPPFALPASGIFVCARQVASVGHRFAATAPQTK